MRKILSSILLLINLTLNAQHLDWGAFNGANTGVHSIGQDMSGNLIVTGSFIGTLDFDPGPGVHNLTSVGTGYNLYIQKLTSDGNFIWVRNLEKNSGVSVTTDPLNNIIITGPYLGTMDFDPGLNTYFLSSIGTSWWDIFVLKLDQAGNFMWAKSFGSVGTDESRGITSDLQGNVYITGFFNDTIDLDPGVNTFNLISKGYRDIFIQKLDPNGNFLWGGAIGSDDIDQGWDIAFDSTGYIYLTGTFSGTNILADFDPGPGVYTPSSKGAFILKLDLNGTFIWVKTLDKNTTFDRVFGTNIEVANNFVYVGGWFEGTVDFDPGPAVFTLAPVAGLDWYILKLDTSGNFIWAKGFGSAGTSEFQDKLNSIAVDIDDNVYSTGYYSFTVDFDPGPGIYNSTSVGSTDFYIHKLDASGNFVWVHTFGDLSTDHGKDLLVDNDKNLYVAGIFNGTIDFDPGPNNYPISSSGAFVLKWYQDSCSIFSLVVDSVSNVDCITSGFASGNAQNGLLPYNYSWNTIPPLSDSLLTTGLPGIYTLTVNDANGCNRSSSVLINGPSQGNFDLNINGVFPEFRPGFNSTINLDVNNANCDTIAGQIILVLDSLVNFLSSTPSPDLISGDSIIWQYNNLYYGSPHFISSVNVNTNASLNSLVCFQLIVSPISGDQNPTNNMKDYCFTVIGSYDPNDKQVYPTGVCDQGYILINEKLTYTIRFQNTGTADAINVYILDTLISVLDINSLVVIGKSHEPMITEIINGNILKFRFDNIYLPDSTTNEPASHGYVIYEVSHMAGIVNGSLVNNSASIYFDYNSPILTNAVSNTYVSSIPSLNTQVNQSGNTLIANLSGVSYQWIDCNNNYSPILGETNQTFTVISNGSYAVILTEAGCIDTSSCYIVAVGLDELNENVSVYVFPNPVTSELHLKYFLPVESEIEIIMINSIGQKTVLFATTLSAGLNNLSFSTDKYVEGIYYLQLRINHHIIARKFIKIKNRY